MATLVLLLLFWILGAVTGLSDEDSCPKRSRIDRESLHCYWMSATASTWLEARAVCQRMKGGDIAMVDKPSVQNFIDNSFRLEAPVLVWLRNSISTRITIGQHQHGDGEKGTCSQMTLGLGQWSNSPCNQEHHFICGKEISVSLPSLDSYVIGVPLMSGTYTQSRLQALPLPPDLGQQRVEMMLFPGLWFSHGGQVISLDLVSQPSQVLTMVKVQILRPYCSPTHHLVPPGCSSLLNPFSCCSVEPMCNTTGACISGLYWCHLQESCLPVTSPCSPYHSSAAGLVFPLPPRYPAVPPFYHMMADMSLKIPPASEPVHFRVTLQEKGIPVYPDDIIAVQHSRKAGEFLHCVSSSDSAWQQSYLSLSGPELGGWVEVGVSVPTDGGQWVDNMLCDLRLIYEDPIHLYGVPPVPGSTQSDLRIDATTPTTHLVKPQTPVSGLHVLYPALDQENQIHLPVNVQITIIIKILSGHGATSTWSAPVLRTGIPFQLSCPSDMSEIQAVCKRETPDVWFSYVDIKLSTQGEQTLNITASNTLNSQMLSVKLQAHIPVTGLSIQPQGFHRVLVDIPQEFTAAVATGSSVKYTWVTDNLVQFAYTGQTYNVVFKKQAEYMLKVTAKNPVSSQFLEVKLTADVMAPLADLTLLSKEEAIAVNTPNIYTLSVKVDISIEVTVRWDFGDTCVNHTFSAPLERMNTSLDQTTTQIYLQDSVLYTYTTPGDYTLRIQAENKYDRIKKDVPIKVRSPLTRVLVSSMPAVPKVDQSILFEASSFPSSYGILYTWNLGDGSQELQGPHNKISHVFKAAGVYNVSVCSNNTLSLMIAWMAVEVVEAISGVQLSYNGPNELNSVTEIIGRVSTGNGLRWTFELGDGSVFKDLPKSSISHIYKSVGNYTAQVTVSNAVSSMRLAIDVEIYQLAINGIQPSDCIMSGKEVNLQAAVTGNVSSLTFHWSFGDGTLLSVKTGTSAVAHTFSGSGNYLIDLSVYSQAGSAHYQATVCVEALITDLSLHSVQNAVAVGKEVCFEALVLPSGARYQFLWYDSSSSDSPVSGKTHHCFVFTKEGMHEIMLITHNQVSSKRAKATIFVQRPVLKLSIQHEGISDALAINQSYSFWTEPYQDNGVVEWDFGDGSPKKEGQNQSHAFTSAGKFRVTASVFNAVSQEFMDADVDVQVPISTLVIHTNQPYVEAGQEAVFTAVCNVVDGIRFYWTVDPIFPSKLGTLEYRSVFATAGIFKIKLMAQNHVSKLETSTSIEVVERIQGVQITGQVLKSMRYFPTKETITLTAFVKHGSNLTYHWLVHHDGFNGTVGDGEHFKLLTNSSGNVSISLTVANVLGIEHKDVTLRAVECVSGVNISTPAHVIAKAKPVKISVSVKTGTDLQYIWFLDSDMAPLTTDVPFVLHVFKAVGIFKLRVSVGNVFGSVDATKQLTVQEYISEVDFKVDGKTHSFFVTPNSLLQFHGSARHGNVLHWDWTVAVQGRNVSILGNNQTVSYSFMDVGHHRVTLNVSNDISWQSVSHIITVEDAIQGLNLRVSEAVVCENDAVTFTPIISQGSGVSFLLEFTGRNSSLLVLKDFTLSSLTVGNHTVKAIASNHVSILSATVAVQVLERVKGLHFCCSTVLEALKPFRFKASVITGAQVIYQWRFKLNSFSSSQEIGQNVLYTPMSNGSLSVTVEASSSTLCLQSITETVAVQWLVKDAKLVVSSDGPFIDCPVKFLALADSGSDLMFRWDFGDSFDDAVKVTKSNTVDHKYKVKGRFLVQVTVFNNVSQVSAQLPVVVRKLECKQPRVTLIQDQLKILRAMPNYFEARVELNGCVTYKTTYLWEIYHDPNCIEKKMLLSSSVDVATPFLSLPKHTLEVGDYCLRFSTRFQGTPLHHHQTAKISVVYSSLVPIIKGGSHRMWSSQNDLILDGTESYDPDSAAHDDSLQFQWDFTVQQDSMVSHSSESFFPDQVIQCNTSSLILPKHSLETGSVYQFTLTVQKDGRPAVSTKQSVKIYETEVIPVAVKCVSCSQLFSSYVSHSHPVVLVGHCFLCNGTVKFKWTAENTIGDILHLNEVTTSTGDSAPVLVIRPDVLMAGSKYIFTLNVSMPNTGLYGLASIVLKLSSPPQGGSCTLSPEDSVQLLQDRVSFSCSGWVDEDRESAQMMYSLQVAQCKDPGPQCPLITLYRGTQCTFSTLVPLGIVRMRDNASIITLMVQVEDDMGAKVTALRRNLAVVFPVNDQVTTAWLKKKTQSGLSALLQQGNPQDVLPYSAALISLLNQLEAVSVQDFEDRVQMRGNVTRALASLSVSSLQDAAQISSALAHSTAVPSELQCGDCQSRAVEATQKMIKVIREQTKQGDVTPVDTGRNILTVLSNSMTAAQKSKDASGVNYHYKLQDTSETVVSAFQQIGELMQSLMWSRMPGEEALFLKSPQISAVGIRGDPTSNLLCTEPSTHCQFQVPPALSSQLSKESEDVFQVLLIMDTQGNPFVSAADPPISTKLAAMEFATPEGLPITIANLTSDTAIHVTLQKENMDASPRVNITLPSKGSVNFTVRAVEMNPHAGLFITFNFSLIQGPGQINSGQVNVSVSDQQGFPLSQHNHVQKLNLSLSTDIPSMEETIFLTPLLTGSSREMYVTLNSSMSGADVYVSVCVFSSLCQFFSAEQRHWSTEGVSVLRSSTPNTAHCLTQHLTLFGASLFVHPDAILLLPPSDGPVRNVVVGIVCGVLLLIHLLVGLIAHKLDHLESLRLSCIPLCGQAGRYHYRVLVKTGWQRGAGTSAHVGISLYGLNKSGSRHLQREGAFQRNSLDDFQVETDANLGEIWKIRIWHDNTGLDPSWYLQHVVVWDMQMDNMFFFLVEDWLSVENDKNAGMVQKVILATCPQELQHFGRMLRAQLLFGLRDRHLWVSLWERPAHSNFSRAQRVTSCAFLLHLYLAGGAVWYGAVSTKDSSGPVADQMLMNPETILVGMTVAVVMFPLQSLLTSLFRMTKSKVLMELSLPPSPVSDTVEMDVYLSHPDLSCSSFLSMPGGLESSTHEGSSPFTESLGSLKLQSELFRTSNMGNESSVDQWASNDSIFGLPELMGPTRLLKRKRALLQLRLGSPASDIPNPAPSSSPNTRKHAPLFSDEELGSASTDPFLSSTSSGPTTSDSGRYSPDETSLSDFQDRSCSEWSELSGDKPRLYKSPSSVSVCSVASTFLPSLPPDSCSITSNTRIGVARGQPGVMLPSWVLAVVYLLVVLLLGTCLAMVGLYGSKFSNSVVLMWLISAVSAFLTSVLLLEPLKICVQALYLAAVLKPVDPEVEDRLAQETVVRRIVEEQGTKVRPPCGYSLLQAKEEARKVRMVRTLMRNCLVYMMLLLVVLMVNYQENIQEMNSRLLQSAVKRSIISASRGQPNLTALSGWKEAWQWMDQSLITHLHQNVSLSLIGSSRLQRVQSKNICGGNMEEVLEYDLSSMMFTASVLSHSNSHHLRGKSNHTSSLLPWSWSKPKSCMVSQTEEKLLGNSSVSTSHILSGLQTAHWITAETQAVLVEFTQYHRETGLFVPVSILLENTQTHRILSTIFIQSFHIPGSSSGLDLSIALTALLLLFSLCILSAELWAMLREGVQYLRQGWHLLQLLLALLSLAAASLRLCFLSKATACLSTHLSQPNTFTDFHSAALLAQRSSQLSAVLLTLLVLQMVGALRFVRRWVVFGKVLRQACCQMCGVFLLFMLLLLLFSHTGSMLFSGSVEGFRTMWQTNQSLLGLLRGRRALHQLCEQHPVLGPIYCVSVFGVGFWLLGRLCGAVLVHTYKTFQAEMYRPSVEPQDYEMVEFLIKRLKLWMGLSKAKEFRHRVRFEGMESPPSRFSRCSQFSSLSVAESPISSSIPSSPAGPRLISSASSLASECSTLSDSPDLQQYLDRLLPSVDSLLAGFDRVNQLTDDVLNIELQLEKACSRMAENRIQRKDPQLWPQTSQKLSAVSQPDQSQCMDVKSSQQGIPQILPRRRGTHSESSITGPVTHLSAHSGKQAWQHGQTELDIRSFPRRRAWNSGSCHSADPIQRSPMSQNPVAAPVRPRSEEGDRSEVTEGMPIKRRAWHPEGSAME